MTMADDKKQKKASAKSEGGGGGGKAAGGQGAKGAKSEKSEKAQAKSSGRAKGGDGAAATATTTGRPQASIGKPRMAKHYEEQVRPELMKKFNYSNVMQAPRFQKIVINMGVGDALQDQKLMESAANELGQITGQRPSIRKAKKSISNFKLREGVAVGCAVTLRGARMYEFYDRLIHTAVPRIRDFRGLSPRSFDGQGNYNMGVTEQIIFPEINYDKVGKVRGMDVTIVTSARTDEEGRELLRLMQMPFRQR